MRIILTHEQTDFDAIASLLGASLLDDTAVPVLPRRPNRNVRAFLTLYGVDLPFVDPRDVGDQPIDVVCLVDTQSLSSIKGMHEGTQIHVIDHHAPRADLPPDWVLRISETGAITTIFIEGIQERDIHLGVIEATLLLIGIYEDTGSLTYTRTTSRDIRAAAFLLDQGANLSIVSNFLNHPLSLQQQAIYDQLRTSSENHTIHGHNLLIAPGDASEMDEELSTVAHKLRDLVDPDGIILLVKIRGGVQLIARSSSDNIDVAQIAAHFGGGGHPRAAAALIKSEDQSSIYTELIRILPEYIQPAITVKEIMSGIPQLLSPDATVQEVARKMQRYGYEGYPVVRGGKILGLVTRRAVDRALAHKLNLTAASLMEAGNVSISPGASIEQLQTQMTNTGWGQIPVVDPDNSAIVGIVTRTDLLETLAPPYTQSGKRNLVELLENALPPERLTLLREIAAIAQEQRVALYIVGGFVRDLLLNYPSLDFDLVVEGDAILLAQSVKEKIGGRIATHKRFGTAKWFLDPKTSSLPISPQGSGDLNSDSHLPTTLDFITARREFYAHPTALPTVERGSIKLDLHRRDFTINTLALRLDGSHYGDLHNYWGGYNDIRLGLVRVLHSISFVDDPTRMLRAVRYEQRYGFQIGKRTLQLLLEARPLLSRVSGDRIRHEIDNILNEDRVVQMLGRLHEIQLLIAIHPDLMWDDWIQTKIDAIEPPPSEWGIGHKWKGIPLGRISAYTLWLIRLPWDCTQKIISRLRLPRVLKDIVQDASKLWAETAQLEQARPSQIADWLEKYSDISIYCLFQATDNPALKNSLHSYITKWAAITPTITGHGLRERGLPPGPHYRQILTKLRAAWIDGVLTTPDQELAFLETLIEAYKERNSDENSPENPL
ncbi:MAG: CBS domain-containing protein [Anaerolineales bacterium]|nr:CBS domain-containing protein [Anaerolineales bacterium]